MPSFSRVGKFAHALGCLQNWQPVVGNIGTVGAIGSTSGANGRTLEGIGNIGTIGTIGSTSGTNGRTPDAIDMPMVPLVEPRTRAKSISLTVP